MKSVYVIRRFSTTLATLVFVSLATFLAFEVIPGDPVLTMLGPDADPFLIAQLQEELGTNAPVHQRLMRWFADLGRGDLGRSVRYSRPVFELIWTRIVISVMIATASMLLVVVIAVPFGILLALVRRHWLEPLISILIQFGMAIPSFWLGIILISLFSVALRIFPTGGFVHPTEGLFTSLRSITLPAIAIAIPQIAVIVRYTRNSFIDQFNHDYVRTARSKGIPTAKIVFSHVLRNAALPVITVLGMIFSNVVAGTIIVEQVFAIPGLGTLLVNAVSSRDFPLIQGLIIYITFAVVIFNALVDLLYHIVDPRIELS